MNIKTAIIQYLANEFQLEPEHVSEDINFEIDLGINSARLNDLLQKLQDSLGITLPEDKITTITTVGDLLSLVDEDETEI